MLLMNKNQIGKDSKNFKLINNAFRKIELKNLVVDTIRLSKRALKEYLLFSGSILVDRNKYYVWTADVVFDESMGNKVEVSVNKMNNDGVMEKIESVIFEFEEQEPLFPFIPRIPDDKITIDALYDFIIHIFDTLFTDGHFDAVDSILKDFQVDSSSSESILIGVLCATFPAKDNLKNRKDFFDQCKTEFESRKLDTKALLIGLE